MTDLTNEDAISEAVAARRGRPPKSAEKVDVVELAAEVAQPKKGYFPVKLLRNYHPVNDFLVNGEPPTVEQRVKVFAGTHVMLEVNEAKDVIAKGIAVRDDPIV